jgi:hypothetical protein
LVWSLLTYQLLCGSPELRLVHRFLLHLMALPLPLMNLTFPDPGSRQRALLPQESPEDEVDRNRQASRALPVPTSS